MNYSFFVYSSILYPFLRFFEMRKILKRDPSNWNYSFWVAICAPVMKLNSFRDECNNWVESYFGWCSWHLRSIFLWTPMLSTQLPGKIWIEQSLGFSYSTCVSFIPAIGNLPLDVRTTFEHKQCLYDSFVERSSILYPMSNLLLNVCNQFEEIVCPVKYWFVLSL
jgi:hypothetical protein